MPRIEAADGSVRFNDLQRNGLTGTAIPGATIEAINLSTAPAGRLHLIDTLEIATAGRRGKFTGNLPEMQQGDVIRARVRGPDGTIGDWVTFQANGLGTDSRNAHVNLERIELDPADEDGKITVTHNTTRPLSEPGAILRFTNERTGAHVDVKVTDQGSLPDGFTLVGRAGDSFDVAATDGTNNRNFARVAGTLNVLASNRPTDRVDLEDPAPEAEDINAAGVPTYKPVRYTGPLFIDGPKAEDVKQGAIGDCYFPSALASIAYHRPDLIERMIRDNGDGTYTVRFYKTSYGNRPAEAVRIDVDGDLYTRSWGGPVYGTSLGGSTKPDKMELWFPLIEKAYAKWKGSYETIGHGGWSGRVMSSVVGASSQSTWLSSANPDTVYNLVKASAEKGRAMTAGTYSKSESERYVNTRIYANHSYSVLGAEEVDGVKYIKLRNPWGQSEPSGNGPNDGFFRLEVSKFLTLYQSMDVVQTEPVPVV